MGHQAENVQVLNLVQAMIGSISPNFRMVTLEVPAERKVCLRFLLERDEEVDREEIEDIIFEFEALQLTGMDVEVEIVVDERPFHLVNLPGRRVFGRREED